jgi:hypothetical protein
MLLMVLLTQFLILDSFNITDDIESEADPLLLELHSEWKKEWKKASDSEKVTDVRLQN